MAAIYKVMKKGFILHADRKTTTGLKLAWQPFIHIDETNFDIETIVDAIIRVVKASETKERVATPTNWSENSKLFFKQMGLKSKELYHPTTKYCFIGSEKESLIFSPTKHDEPPGQGFVGKDEPDIVVPSIASNQEIFAAFELAMSRCE